jgi:hypothetical protein
MIDVEHQLRDLLRRNAAGAPEPHPAAPIRRTHRRQAILSAGVAILVAGALLAGVEGLRSLPDSAHTRPGDGGAVVTGRLAELSTTTRFGTLRLRASTNGDEVCMHVSGYPGAPVDECVALAGLPGRFLTAAPGGRRWPGAVEFGVTSADASSVELRYSGGGAATAEIATARVTTGTVRVYLLASNRISGTGLLAAYDGSGATVGDPQWLAWADMGKPGEVCECPTPTLGASS